MAGAGARAGRRAARPAGGDRRSGRIEAQAPLILASWRRRRTPPTRSCGARSPSAATVRLRHAAAVLPPPPDHAQKKTGHASEQERPDVVTRRQAWFDGQPELEPERLVFIDETWAKTKSTRGWTNGRRVGVDGLAHRWHFRRSVGARRAAIYAADPVCRKLDPATVPRLPGISLDTLGGEMRKIIRSAVLRTLYGPILAICLGTDAGAQESFEVEPTVEIPQNYDSWSLFLICNPAWLARNGDEENPGSVRKVSAFRGSHRLEKSCDLVLERTSGGAIGGTHRREPEQRLL